MTNFQNQLSTIASAIRDKRNVSKDIPFSKFAEEIEGIESGRNSASTFMSYTINANSSNTKTFTYPKPLSDSYRSIVAFESNGDFGCDVVNSGTPEFYGGGEGSAARVITSISSSKTSITFTIKNNATKAWGVSLYIIMCDL